MKKLVALSLLAIVLFVVACGAQPAVAQSGNFETVRIYSSYAFLTYRHIDKELGIVCYQTSNSIHCLPIPRGEK